MSISAGDAACTTGLSGAIYTAWTGDAGNGFSGSLTAGQQALLKSQCFQWATAIAARLVLEAVYASAASATGQSIPHNANTVINMSIVATDSHGAVTTGAAWQFAVPSGRSGLYLIAAAASLNAPVAGCDQILGLNRNGSEYLRLQRMPGNTTKESGLSGTTVLNLNAGDTIAPIIFQNSGSPVTLESSAIANWITITRLVGF